MSESNSQDFDPTTQQYWDEAAEKFDDAPDHGLHDPLVLHTWTELLRTSLQEVKGSILDIGCGTGSLSVILASLGYKVTGIDLSPKMISLAQAKAKRLGHTIDFQVMDAAYPLLSGQFDAIICRHLLWALPNIRMVLKYWVNLLKQSGWLVLIEGYWHTGAGLHSIEVLDALPTSLVEVSVQNLSDQPALWGKTVQDERYLLKAKRI